LSAKERLLLWGLMNSLDPRLSEFILFCVERRGKEWPAIYDEMALVAGQGLFKGLGYTELSQLGLSLAASKLDRLIQQVEQVTAQHQELQASYAESCRAEQRDGG
jgi:hypothetical protein